MNIIIKESGKRFELKMQVWKDNRWVSLNAEDLIVDSSFHYDRDLEAWAFTGRENDLTNWLWDWENYNTEADIQTLSAEERTKFRNEYDRYFEFMEVEKWND